MVDEITDNKDNVEYWKKQYLEISRQLDKFEYYEEANKALLKENAKLQQIREYCNTLENYKKAWENLKEMFITEHNATDNYEFGLCLRQNGTMMKFLEYKYNLSILDSKEVE